MKQAMNSLNALYVRLLLAVKNERGQGLVEYALIIVLIAIAAIVAMKFLGGSVNNVYSSAGSTLAKP